MVMKYPFILITANKINPLASICHFLKLFELKSVISLQNSPTVKILSEYFDSLFPYSSLIKDKKGLLDIE